MNFVLDKTPLEGYILSEVRDAIMAYEFLEAEKPAVMLMDFKHYKAMREALMILDDNDIAIPKFMNVSILPGIVNGIEFKSHKDWKGMCDGRA